MIFTESRHKVLMETGQRQVPLSRISLRHERCPSSPTGLYTGLTIKAISNEPSDCRNTPFDKKIGYLAFMRFHTIAFRAAQSRQLVAAEGPCLASAFANEISGSFSFNGLQESTSLKGCA